MMKRESQCCLCEGRKKRKIDLPLSASEKEEIKKKKNMMLIDLCLPGIKKQFGLQIQVTTREN